MACLLQTPYNTNGGAIFKTDNLTEIGVNRCNFRVRARLILRLETWCKALAEPVIEMVNYPDVHKTVLCWKAFEQFCPPVCAAITAAHYRMGIMFHRKL
jgi:hypothetical protein